MIRIEYVCSNHNGLSPMADAIARDQLRRGPYHELIRVFSSGSALHHSFQLQGKELVKMQRQVVSQGLRHGLFKGMMEKDAEGVLSRNRYADADILGHCYRQLLCLERAFCDIALWEKGYYYGGIRPVATERDEINLILAMNKENIGQVQAIYGSLCAPKIVLYSEYAEVDEEISNLLSAPLEKHQETRDILRRSMPKVITRAKNEFL